MAPMTDAQIERRARWTYELGRIRWASHVLLFALPLLVVARLIHRPLPLILGIGGALCALSLVLAVVHERYRRAILAGILAGVPALILPFAAQSLGMVQVGPAVFDPCIPACFISGVLAGAFVAGRAAGESRSPSFWFAALAVTALTGALGCSVAGSAGVLGLVAGVAVGATPVLLRTELRRT
jgi:hypothetical protein